MRQQYDDLDADEVHETVAGQDLVGYDMNFYCLDLTNTAQVRSYNTPDAAYVIFCQADDREFAEIEEIFRAITISLLRKSRPHGERTDLSALSSGNKACKTYKPAVACKNADLLACLGVNRDPQAISAAGCGLRPNSRGFGTPTALSRQPSETQSALGHPAASGPNVRRPQLLDRES